MTEEIGVGMPAQRQARLRRQSDQCCIDRPDQHGPSKWPFASRGTGALPPAHLDMHEQVKPIEQHGFTIADFSPDKIVLRMFKWDVKTQSVDAIDTLEPFHSAELMRAG